jgi:hypothetical protein
LQALDGHSPSFRISAISGAGCRELTQKLQEALELPRCPPAQQRRAAAAPTHFPDDLFADRQTS